jgi:hypothetical protein
LTAAVHRKGRGVGDAGFAEFHQANEGLQGVTDNLLYRFLLVAVNWRGRFAGFFLLWASFGRPIGIAYDVRKSGLICTGRML